jgi:hypothetical protein
MNAPFTPVDNYADLGALLRLLVDPVATQQRLDELIAQQTATKAEIATLNEMAADTRRLHSAAEAMNIVLTNRKTALDAQAAALDARAETLEQSESARSDAALRRREAAVLAREQGATREADRLAALRTDYEGRLAKIKNLTTTLER